MDISQSWPQLHHSAAPGKVPTYTVVCKRQAPGRQAGCKSIKICQTPQRTPFYEINAFRGSLQRHSPRVQPAQWQIAQHSSLPLAGARFQLNILQISSSFSLPLPIPLAAHPEEEELHLQPCEAVPGRCSLGFSCLHRLQGPEVVQISHKMGKGNSLPGCTSDSSSPNISGCNISFLL